jgi:hypothetical protein
MSGYRKHAKLAGGRPLDEQLGAYSQDDALPHDATIHR